jgi:hypothetical protein
MGRKIPMTAADGRASFDAQSAKLAFDRSVEFFRQNIG